MNKSKFFKNIVTGFGGQLIALLLGLIVPRFLITNYGSDINGLLSTITQIFTYMALLEAGIGQASRNALYQPVAKHDKAAINDVLSVSRTYFRKLSIYYGLGVVVLAVSAPFFIKTNVDKLTIFLMVVFEGLSGVISFYFIQTPSILIRVDGKNYINNYISLLNKMVGYLAKIILSSFGLSIILIQFCYFIITVAKVVFYRIYFAKNYSWVSYKKTERNVKLKDRNSYVITEIAWTVFSSTDMIVLSTFVSTQVSSVYSIYSMVFSQLNVLLNSVYTSVSYLLGYAYHDSIEEYEKMHDVFTTLFLGAMTVLMSVCFFMTIPFVSLYTHGVKDIEYIYPNLPLLFCLVQMLSWSRMVSGNLTGLAGYAKQTSYISLFEAIINVTLSIVLVRRHGIVGVLFATVIALPLKVIWCIYVADKKVMHRSFKKSISIIGINFLIFFGSVIVSCYFQPNISSYIQFLVWGVILVLMFGVVGMGLNFIVNRDCWSVVKKYMLRH